jgi:hypothetical protein
MYIYNTIRLSGATSSSGRASLLDGWMDGFTKVDGMHGLLHLAIVLSLLLHPPMQGKSLMSTSLERAFMDG